MTTLRSAWDVTAGLILGRPDDQHTKRFVLTSDDMESDPTGRFLATRQQAIEYATSIMDPAYLNWVRIDWVWF
jgi:hypothetical protein